MQQCMEGRGKRQSLVGQWSESLGIRQGEIVKLQLGQVDHDDEDRRAVWRPLKCRVKQEFREY